MCLEKFLLQVLTRLDAINVDSTWTESRREGKGPVRTVLGILDRQDKGRKPLSRSFLDKENHDSPNRLASFCGTYHLFKNFSGASIHVLLTSTKLTLDRAGQDLARWWAYIRLPHYGT